MTDRRATNYASRLGSETSCPGCGDKPCTKLWVFAGGGYANDPLGARAALIRAHQPKSTPEEVAANHAFITHPDREKERAQLVPTRRGYGVTIASERGEGVIAGGEGPLPRPAHNRENAGSIPAPAIAPHVDRRTRLRIMANSRPHRCAGYGCTTSVPGHDLMCDDHWRFVPRDLQAELTEAFDPAAELRWPVELVERAIRATMTDDDVTSLIGRVEWSLQEGLFAGAGR